MSVWPLFGSANQLLSALVLTALAVFLKATGREGRMLWVPMGVMFCVTMTALAMALWKIFGTIQAGIPVPGRARRDERDRTPLAQGRRHGRPL